jgi:SAM-dependent methyltransferase
VSEGFGAGDRIEAKEFWETQEADISSMLLNGEAAGGLAGRDFEQIIGTLPPLASRHVLELGAGIGRFTRYFAEKAGHVTAVDFSENFVEANRSTYGAFSNITFLPECSRRWMRHRELHRRAAGLGRKARRRRAQPENARGGPPKARQWR